MCLGCWDEAGRPFKVTDAVLTWSPKFGNADKFGPLHIVVEDWNLEDDNLTFCRNLADASDDDKALMDAMLKMSEPERWATAILSDYPEFDLAQYGVGR